MKISAFIVAYNEEKHIERCLKSLEGVVDEVIVVHDGECKDCTLEIAKKYKAKVFIQEHKGMAELHMVYAIEQCQYDWILQQDADEFLSQKLRKNIKKLVQDQGIDGYSFVWPIWDGVKYLTKKQPHKNFLFRKNKLYYFAFPGKGMRTYGNQLKSNLIVEHQPLYNNYTLNRFRSKWMKWIDVHAKFFYRKEFDAYNCNEEVLNRFQDSIDKQKKYANPVLAPLWMIQSIVVSMLRHGYWKNIKTWKVAFFQGLYGFYLCIYIWKYRKVKSIE